MALHLTRRRRLWRLLGWRLLRGGCGGGGRRGQGGVEEGLEGGGEGQGRGQELDAVAAQVDGLLDQLALPPACCSMVPELCGWMRGRCESVRQSVQSIELGSGSG